jgi:hypothetical protein
MVRIKEDIATTLLIDFRDVLLQRFGNSVAINPRVGHEKRLFMPALPMIKHREGMIRIEITFSITT